MEGVCKSKPIGQQIAFFVGIAQHFSKPELKPIRQPLVFGKQELKSFCQPFIFGEQEPKPIRFQIVVGVEVFVSIAEFAALK